MFFLTSKRCQVCFGTFEKYTTISVTDSYSNKNFFIYNEKNERSIIRSYYSLSSSARNSFIGPSRRILCLSKPRKSGFVVSLEAYCRKCSSTAYWEYDLNCLTGNNLVNK